MPRTCWVPGCSSGYRTSSDKNRHLFTVPVNKLKEWSRRIPREEHLTSKHCVCDLHFEEKFIKKHDEIIIDGKPVRLSRERWMLTPDAIPTIFPNLPHYLSSRTSRRLSLNRHMSVASTHSVVTKVVEPVNCVADCFSDETCELLKSDPVNAEHSYASRGGINVWQLQLREINLRKKIRQQSLKIQHLCTSIRKLENDNKALVICTNKSFNHPFIFMSLCQWLT